MQAALLSMLLIPLVGSFLNGLVLRPHSPKRAGVIGSFCAVMSFVCAFSLFLSVHSRIKKTHKRKTLPHKRIQSLRRVWGNGALKQVHSKNSPLRGSKA